jgi:hypothetical protein
MADNGVDARQPQGPRHRRPPRPHRRTPRRVTAWRQRSPQPRDTARSPRTRSPGTLLISRRRPPGGSSGQTPPLQARGRRGRPGSARSSRPCGPIRPASRPSSSPWASRGRRRRTRVRVPADRGRGVAHVPPRRRTRRAGRCTGSPTTWFVEPGRSLHLDRARRRIPGPSGRMVRHTARVPQLTLTQDPRADELLGRDPLALLLGMLFDQQMRQRSSGACRRNG